ncbi:MAG: hypothetical protein AVO35_03415 [Candidatus Aegiribacteria sp. MLS_C]|nr:MAG: hypothetical protein AVO35_03415 [Candidatus Aegiribacteria sp. MLS_C]
MHPRHGTAVLTCVLLLAGDSRGDTVPERITRDLESGGITRLEAAELLEACVTDPGALPSRYTEGTEDQPCGTPALLAALRLREEPPGEASRPLLSGPEYTIDSPAGHFKLHWTDSGADSTNYGYVVDLAVAADTSWLVQCDQMGFFQPPPDNGEGGDDLYDIYVVNLSGGVLGYCTCSGEYQPPDSTHECSASHIVVDSGISSKDLRKCVVAHEFHHAVQASYDYGEGIGFVEQCAVWMVELVYPEVDDWYGSISSGENSLRTPWTGVFQLTYGGFPWPWMMWDRWGYESVRSVWEYCAAEPGNNTREANGYMIGDHGMTMEQFFMDYGLWRWFTAGNWYSGCGMYNPDAALWLPGPRVLPQHEVASLPFSGDQTEYFPPDTYGIHWIRVDLSDMQDQWVRMEFDGRDGFKWDLGVIMQDLSGRFCFQWYECDAATGEVSVSVGASGWDYAVFFPAFVDETSLDHLYQFQLSSSTGIEGGYGGPEGFGLALSSNPPGPGAFVSFSLPSSERVLLRVYDMSGRAAASIMEGMAGPGSHEIPLDGMDLAPGTYFVVLRAGNAAECLRVTMVE